MFIKISLIVVTCLAFSFCGALMLSKERGDFGTKFRKITAFLIILFSIIIFFSNMMHPSWPKWIVGFAVLIIGLIYYKHEFVLTTLKILLAPWIIIMAFGLTLIVINFLSPLFNMYLSAHVSEVIDPLFTFSWKWSLAGLGIFLAGAWLFSFTDHLIDTRETKEKYANC